MATATKRQTPPTHPTVWIGLGLAAIGLLVAVYAYTGTRIYDIRYALVSLVAGVVALLGILTAAWGRAVMATRAQRARRAASAPGGASPAPAREKAAKTQPPTVAAPASKKKFDFAAAARRVLPGRTPKAEKPKSPGGVFAFRAATPPPAEAPPAESQPVPVEEGPVERLTLKCPQCETKFSAEGRRPFEAKCPGCAFAAPIK